MNDQELAARARQLAEDGVRSAEAQALARELLRQLADRLDGPVPDDGGMMAEVPIDEAIIGDLQELTGVALASIVVLDRGHMTTGVLRSDVVAMRSILKRIDARLDSDGPV